MVYKSFDFVRDFPIHPFLRWDCFSEILRSNLRQARFRVRLKTQDHDLEDADLEGASVWKMLFQTSDTVRTC